MDQQNLGGERSGRPAFVEEKADSLYWLGALVLTLAVRLYLFENYYTINNDGVLYIEAARHFWEGAWREGLASFEPPLFPLMIAAVYPLMGDWELAGQFWPLVLGVMILAPLFALLRSVYGSRVGQIGVFFYALSPYLARLSVHVRSEIPYIFLLLIVLFFLQRSLDKQRLLPLFFAGLISALAYLIRPEGMGIVLVAALFMLYRARGRRRSGRAGLQVAALSLGFVVFSLPYPLYLHRDTGSWMISRKTTFVLSSGLAEYDPSVNFDGADDSVEPGVVALIAQRPFVYAQKVIFDIPRSAGVYLEAVHYSYIPFLFVGWFYFFRGRFWEKQDFLFFFCVVFYLLAFAALTPNRRFTVPLVPLSLGWVAVGYEAVTGYLRSRWARRARLLTGIAIVAFLAGTLPKTLQSIGQEKLFLREAGLYLRGMPGNPNIFTTDSRVAFYARGKNRVFRVEPKARRDFLNTGEGDYLALDAKSFAMMELSLQKGKWSLVREFSSGKGEQLFVLRRGNAS